MSYFDKEKVFSPSPKKERKHKIPTLKIIKKRLDNN